MSTKEAKVQRLKKVKPTWLIVSGDTFFSFSVLIRLFEHTSVWKEPQKSSFFFNLMSVAAYSGSAVRR